MVEHAKMFPTHVGIARRRRPWGGRSGNVPYACGDCADLWRRSGRTPVCSLRMWGLRGRPSAGRMRTEMFPTHVGIARNALGPRRVHKDVPYACGDCAKAFLVAPSRPGCSLRMWGLRERINAAIWASRMFPTHVGIARGGAGPGGFRGHVPYACGDCATVGM